MFRSTNLEKEKSNGSRAAQSLVNEEFPMQRYPQRIREEDPVIQQDAQCPMAEKDRVILAGQCLREIQINIRSSAFDDEWGNTIPEFCSAIYKNSQITDVTTPLAQLRLLENHVKYSRQTFSWKAWKRNNWRVMTDPALEIPDKISHFIMALKFMEQNLILEAHDDIWMAEEREKWLHKCDSLVPTPFQQESISNALLKNVNEALTYCGYNPSKAQNDLVSCLHTERSKIQETVQCLMYLESNIKISALDKQWREKRRHFISAIENINDLPKLGVLFQQLQSFDKHVKYEKQSDKAREWERVYWEIMASANLEAGYNVTRFIITIKFMEENLLSEVLIKEWKDSNRDKWLKKCDNLVEPVQQHLFYNELLQNISIGLELFGYDSFQAYESHLKDIVSHIHRVVEVLEDLNTGTGIAETAAGSLVIASGVLSGIGLILAPFTAGISTILTLTSFGVGAVSASTSVTSTVLQGVQDKTKTNEVQEQAKKLIGMTFYINALLMNFSSSITELRTKLSTLSNSDALKYVKDVGTSLSSMVDGGQNIAAIVTIARRIIGQGFRTNLAFDSAVPFVFRETTSLLSAGAIISALLSAVNIVIGIASTVMAARKTMNGSEAAKRLRKLSGTLQSAVSETFTAYNCAIMFYANDNEENKQEIPAEEYYPQDNPIDLRIEKGHFGTNDEETRNAEEHSLPYDRGITAEEEHSGENETDITPDD